MEQSSAESFKVRDATSYDAVAGSYDWFTERFSGPLAARIVELADVRPAMRVLDVGAGTGIVSFEAAHVVGDAGHVLGIDLSEGMLAVARQKADARRLGGCIEFRQMDAENLSLADGSFDAVVSLFALHHFPNPAGALREMLRVLRPGGRLCIGMGSGPNRLSVPGVIDAASQVVDLVNVRLGRLLKAPDFMNQLVKAEFPLAEEDELTNLASLGWKELGTVPTLVRAAGFSDVRTDWLGLRREIDTPQEFLDMQRVNSSMARKRLSGLAPTRLEAFERTFIERCEAVQRCGGKLAYTYAALFVSARRDTSRVTIE